MKRLVPAIVAVSAAVAACTAAGVTTGVRPSDGRDAGAVRAAGSWGRAAEVPGLGALNKGGNAGVSSVSCASPGSCAAVGDYYTDASGQQQGFVVSEINGAWGRAVEVPGLGTLNKGGNAGVSSVSCASAANCAAGGDYTDAGGLKNKQGFVVSESNGAWGRAIEVPGLAALNTNGGAYVTSVSCASAGNCAAGGDYDYDYSYGFVVSEKNGAWGKAITVPGLPALGAGRFTDVNSVSCASPGNCAAGGDGEFLYGAFVVSASNGVWGQAIKVPGLAALNHRQQPTGEVPGVASVSCALAGSCAAGGDYLDGHGHYQGFVT